MHINWFSHFVSFQDWWLEACSSFCKVCIGDGDAFLFNGDSLRFVIPQRWQIGESWIYKFPATNRQIKLDKNPSLRIRHGLYERQIWTDEYLPNLWYLSKIAFFSNSFPSLVCIYLMDKVSGLFLVMPSGSWSGAELSCGKWHKLYMNFNIIIRNKNQFRLCRGEDRAMWTGLHKLSGTVLST